MVWNYITNYWTYPESRPDYESDEPDPGTQGRGVSYRCLETGCGWQGRSGAKAFDHHRDSRHHRIANAAGVVQIFGCCLNGSAVIEREFEFAFGGVS